jgi:thiamine-phosphate pyrophosphorylase
MKLIVISNPVVVAGEADIINQLFRTGLKHFHLRKPGYSLVEIRKLLRQVSDEYYQFIALHQAHELASEFGIGRLHFPEKMRRDTSSEKLSFQNESGYKLSTSIHCIADLDGLVGFDLAFFSPVFNSISKPHYHGTISPDFKHKQRNNIDLIALGGICAENVQQCITMKFNGVAVLGTIWNEPMNAVKNYSYLMNAMNYENYR